MVYPSRRKQEETMFPKKVALLWSDIGIGGKTKHLPDASREVPERTCNDTKRRRNCTDCSVLPLRRCIEFDSQVFLVTRPKRSDGYGCSPSGPRGLSVISPFERQDGNSISNPCAQNKQGFWKIEVLRAG